jgi:hypothetical protein
MKQQLSKIRDAMQDVQTKLDGLIKRLDETTQQGAVTAQLHPEEVAAAQRQVSDAIGEALAGKDPTAA